MPAEPIPSMTTEDTVPDWRITGDWWDLCNCAIALTAPCTFGMVHRGRRPFPAPQLATLQFRLESDVWLLRGRADLADPRRQLWRPRAVLGIVGDSHRNKFDAVEAECQIAPRLERAACEACEDLFQCNSLLRVGTVIDQKAELVVLLENVTLPVNDEDNGEVFGERRGTPAASTMPRDLKSCPASLLSARPSEMW